MTRAWRSAGALFGEFAALVVPLACAGCGEEDVALCESCSAPWWEQPWRADDGAPRLDVEGVTRLPVWTITPLDGPAHRAVSAWKDGARRDLDRFFADAISRAARSLRTDLAPVPRTLVVPVPSQPRSVRRRGADLPGLLARSAAIALPAPARAAALLRSDGGRSRGRSSAARWDAARTRVVGSGAREPVVIVDDVITTGASIVRAADALERAGYVPVAGLTLAATPPRGVRVRPGLG